MEVGGLMAEGFKIFLGNPDIIVVLIGWSVFVSLLLTVVGLSRKN